MADAAALVSGDRIADGSTDCSTDGRTDECHEYSHTGANSRKLHVFPYGNAVGRTNE